MKTKFYQQIPVGRELPSKAGKYITDVGTLDFIISCHNGEDRKYWDPESDSPNIWLKEIPLHEWMVEWAEWLAKNAKHDTNIEIKPIKTKKWYQF